MSNVDQIASAESEHEAPSSHGALMLRDLHPLVADAAEPYWVMQDYAGAVKAAWFALRDELRERLDVDLDGTKLMDAIGEGRPKLLLTDHATETEQNMHRGLVRLLVGLVLYVRNPMMHDANMPHVADPIPSFECLALMSLCARRVASAIHPMTVDEVVREASQPKFPTGAESRADLIKALPASQLPALVKALAEAFRESASDGRRRQARTLREIYEDALRVQGSNGPATRAAARLCRELIADDETFDQGVALLTASVYRLLPPRHRAKVAQALVRDTEEGRMGWGRFESGGTYFLPLISVFDELNAIDRRKIVRAIQKSLAGADDAQRFAIGLLTLLSSFFRDDERADVAVSLAVALIGSSPDDRLYATARKVLAAMEVQLMIGLQTAISASLALPGTEPPDRAGLTQFQSALKKAIEKDLGIDLRSVVPV